MADTKPFNMNDVVRDSGMVNAYQAEKDSQFNMNDVVRDSGMVNAYTAEKNARIQGLADASGNIGYTPAPGVGTNQSFTPGPVDPGLGLTKPQITGESTGTMYGPEQPTAAGTADTTAAPSGPVPKSVAAQQMLDQVNQIEKMALEIQSQLYSTTDDLDAVEKTFGQMIDAEFEATKGMVPDPEAANERSKQVYDYTKEFNDQQIELNKMRMEAALRAEEAQWAAKEGDLEQRHRKETGATAQGLARAGGYLGFTGSHQATLVSLEQVHDREMSMFQSLRSAALNEIRNSFEDRNIELMKENLAAYGKLMDDINERENTHFNQIMQVTQEARAKVTSQMTFEQQSKEFEYGKGMDMLDMMRDSVASGKMPTKEEIMDISERTGMEPSAISTYWQASKNTYDLDKKYKDAEVAADLRAEERDMISILTRIDKGTFVDYNGKKYEGLNTPAASSTSVGTASDGNKVITPDDWMKKYNKSVYVQPFVGSVSDQQLLEMFAPNTQAPQWFVDEQISAYNDLNGILDGEGALVPDIAAGDAVPQDIQMAWDGVTSNVWGITSTRSFQMYSSEDQANMVDVVAGSSDADLQAANLPPRGLKTASEYIAGLSQEQISALSKAARLQESDIRNQEASSALDTLLKLSN